MSDSEEQWDEERAVWLLREAGALVAAYAAEGARIPDREMYHARITEAHDARDMDAYREALNGYVQVARESYRRRSRGEG